MLQRQICVFAALLAVSALGADIEAPVITLDLTWNTAHAENKAHASGSAFVDMCCDGYKCDTNQAECKLPKAQAWDHHDGEVTEDIVITHSIFVESVLGCDPEETEGTGTITETEFNNRITPGSDDYEAFRGEFVLKYDVKDDSLNEAETVTYALIMRDTFKPTYNGDSLVQNSNVGARQTNDQQTPFKNIKLSDFSDNFDGSYVDVLFSYKAYVDGGLESTDISTLTLKSSNQACGGTPDTTSVFPIPESVIKTKRGETYLCDATTVNAVVSDYADIFGVNNADNARTMTFEYNLNDDGPPVITRPNEDLTMIGDDECHGKFNHDSFPFVSGSVSATDDSCTCVDGEKSLKEGRTSCGFECSTHFTANPTIKSCGTVIPEEDIHWTNEEYTTKWGPDLGETPTRMTQEECIDACETTAKCKGWSFRYGDPAHIHYQKCFLLDNNHVKFAPGKEAIGHFNSGVCTYGGTKSAGHVVVSCKAQDYQEKKTAFTTSRIEIVDTTPPNLSVYTKDEVLKNHRSATSFGDKTHTYWDVKEADAFKHTSTIQHRAGYTQDAEDIEALRDYFSCTDVCTTTHTKATWHKADMNQTCATIGDDENIEMSISDSGTYLLKYVCSDENGNTATKCRTLINEDAEKAILEFVNEDNDLGPCNEMQCYGVPISATGEYVDEGATCSDETDGVISELVEVSGDVVSPQILGTYYIRYDCTDKAGFQADPITRMVVVFDDVCPTCEVAEGTQTVNVEASFPYSDDVPTCSDNYLFSDSEELTTEPVIAYPDGLVDVELTGSYVISYTIHDMGQNTNHHTKDGTPCNTDIFQARTVIVEDTLKPAIQLDYQDLMAESASVNGWVFGAMASAAVGIALLAFPSRKTATTVPV
jgi:hypothetical protein